MVSMARQRAGSKVWRLARWRPWVQLTFLAAWLGPFLPRWHVLCSPVFHCYSCPWALLACPIGILANFSALHLIPYIALGTLFAVGAVFGSFVCGWACPFGYLQDLAARLPTPKFKLPAFLGWGRYAVLFGLVIAVPYWFGEDHPLFFCRLCPAGALEGAVPFVARQAIARQAIAWPSAAKIAILVVFLIAILFTYRPWCAVFCPLGAVFTACNRVSFLFVRFHADRCNDCDRCRDLCQARAPSQQRAGDLRCIRCLDCNQCRALSVGTIFGGGGDAPRLKRSDPPLVQISETLAGPVRGKDQD
jgi:ferredoxin-type protein NapH